MSPCNILFQRPQSSMSGGYRDAGCDHASYGDGRGPVNVEISNFRRLKDDASVVRLDLGNARFLVLYDRRAGWTHWQHQADGTWAEVERRAVADSTNWWLWDGKILATLRSLIIDGMPSDATVERTAGGGLRFSGTLRASHANMWDWERVDRLGFTLDVDADVTTVKGYTWERYLNRAANPGKCLRYYEAGTDGTIGVEVAVPDEVRQALNGGG